ncbi:hypothetical protein KEJ49_03845 [Candidatus Bathyarchaeota archaeon]|nr:hypothetical protein [Candidatus Bathyarchaeota archaeon]
MNFDEKMDAIDLIINVLREHEKSLDELVSRLEELLSKAPAGRGAEAERPTIRALVREWKEFRERCSGAGIASFEVEDKKFRVSALKGGVLHIYEEMIPDMEIRFREREDRIVIDEVELRGREMIPAALRGRLNCGLEISVKGEEIKMPDGVSLYRMVYDLEAEKARNWLANQLKMDPKNIIHGRIQA